MTALVTIEHVRALGYLERTDGMTFCASGIREWCSRHGIDYLQLVYQGVPADTIRATDSWGVKLADMAEEEQRGRQ